MANFFNSAISSFVLLVASAIASEPFCADSVPRCSFNTVLPFLIVFPAALPRSDPPVLYRSVPASLSKALTLFRVKISA